MTLDKYINDFGYVNSLFLRNDEKTLKSHSVTQENKFDKLFTEEFCKHDPMKIISNYELVESLFPKELNLSLSHLRN